MQSFNFQDYIPYILPLLFVLYFVRRKFMFKKVRENLKTYLNAGAVIVDVRSPAEFQSGCVPGSINIPLQNLQSKAAQLDKSKPILLCCASGARSGAAETILKTLGFQAINAGPWNNLI